MPIVPGLPPEVASLLDEVKAHPEDDAPRLILGDWLQEQGDAALAGRGEFIHVQIRRARLSPDDPLQLNLQQRERQLLGRYALDWLGILADCASHWDFERGLIKLEGRARRFLGTAADDVPSEAAVWVDELKLTELFSPQVSVLARLPLLGELNTLDLSGNRLAPLVFAALLKSPLLRRLTTLRLGQCVIGRGGAGLLARASSLPRLRTLDLTGNRIGDQGVQELVETCQLPNLTTLYVGGNAISPEGVAALRGRFGPDVLLAVERRES